MKPWMFTSNPVNSNSVMPKFFADLVQGPSSIMAHNLVEVLFLYCSLSALNFWGMFVRVYPKIVQGLTFLNSVKHITIILARCTS